MIAPRIGPATIPQSQMGPANESVSRVLKKARKKRIRNPGMCTLCVADPHYINVDPDPTSEKIRERIPAGSNKISVLVNYDNHIYISYNHDKKMS